MLCAVHVFVLFLIALPTDLPLLLLSSCQVANLLISYASGGEDGYIRVHQFDQSYFDFEFEC